MTFSFYTWKSMLFIHEIHEKILNVLLNLKVLKGGLYWLIVCCFSPWPDHHSVTCAKPIGYNSLAYMYVPGYSHDFIVHMVYNITCCLQARNELNEYIYDNYAINKNLCPFDWYFKMMYVQPIVTLTSLETKTCLTKEFRPTWGLRSTYWFL